MRDVLHVPYRGGGNSPRKYEGTKMLDGHFSPTALSIIRCFIYANTNNGTVPLRNFNKGLTMNGIVHYMNQVFGYSGRTYYDITNALIDRGVLISTGSPGIDVNDDGTYITRGREFRVNENVINVTTIGLIKGLLDQELVKI